MPLPSWHPNAKRMAAAPAALDTSPDPSRATVSPIRGPSVDALEPYLRARYVLFPLNRWDFIDHKGRKRGKSPRDARWRQIDYAVEDVLAWVRKGGNPGVRLGELDVVIDVDLRNLPPGVALDQALREFERRFGVDLSWFPCVVTGSGGLHFYGRLPRAARILNDLPGLPGFEFKSLGRLVVAAGAVHPDGGQYEWEALSADLADVPEIPTALFDAIRKPEEPERAEAAPAAIPLGALEECLAQLDVLAYRSHDDWLEVMMAAHSASGGSAEGREAFVRWSVADPKYKDDAGVIRERWDSLAAGKPGGVTVGTLYHHVLDAGGAIPAPPPETDFEPIAPDPGEPPPAPKFERDKNGKPKPTKGNAVAGVRALGIEPAFDRFRHRGILRGDLAALRRSFPGVGPDIDDALAHAVAGVLRERWRLEVGLDRIHEALDEEAHRRPFDPLRDYLDGLAWDGTPRIARFLETHAGATPDEEDGEAEYVRTVSRLFFLGAVARAYVPGIKFDTVLILEGEQGKAKSTLVQILAGPFFGPGLANHRALGHADHVAAMQGAWIIELGELAATRRSDVESLKDFVQRQVDRARFAYGRKMGDHPRRCVFVGTVNGRSYLRDATGGRRFWPVWTDRIDLDAVARDRDQLWAEALSEWRRDSKALRAKGRPAHEALFLPQRLRSVAAEEQESRRVADEWEEPIAAELAKLPRETRYVERHTLLNRLGYLGPRDVPNGANERLDRVMTALGWVWDRRRPPGSGHNGAKVRAYWRPER